MLIFKKTILRIIVFWLMLFASGAFADDEKTYLIVMASIVGDDVKQPARIGIRRRRGPIRRVEADAHIVEFYSGSHAIDHIDMGNDVFAANNKIYSVPDGWMKLQKGKINFIGHIQLTPIGNKKYQMSWGDDRALLEKACRKMPSVFDKHPVVWVEMRDEFRFECQE